MLRHGGYPNGCHSHSARRYLHSGQHQGGQTTANQLRELRAAAERLGHPFIAEFTEEGYKRRKRPGGAARPKQAARWRGWPRGDFDKVMAWSVDRLGRSLPDLLTFMGELKAKGVDLYLHQQALDTSTPPGRGHVPDARRVQRV